MNRLLLNFIFFGSIQLASADTPSARILFENQDELTGTWDKFEENRVFWESPALSVTSPFLIETIREIELTPNSGSASPHQVSVSLTNGDVCNGNLKSVSADTVVMDTAYGGVLRLNRLMVEEICIPEQKKFYYKGPNSMDEWMKTPDNSNWTFSNFELSTKSAGIISHRIDFPQEFSISFHLAWEAALHFKLNFASSEMKGVIPDSGYEFFFREQTVSVRNGVTKKILGNTRDAAALQELQSARIEIRFSRKTGKMGLYVNDEFIHSWFDADVDRTQAGDHLCFIASKDTKLQLSKIAVTGWDSESNPLPDPAVPVPQERFDLGDEGEELKKASPPKSGRDRIELRNGDSLVGEVLKVDTEQITLKTPYSEVILPLDALSIIHLPPVTLERCKRETGDCRVSTRNGSSIVFRLLSLEKGILTGESQNFGKAQFELSELSRIEFNIYPRSENELRINGLTELD